MSRPNYLTENLYEAIQKEMENYNSDYEAIQRRNEILSLHQKERACYDEVGMELLRNFGAM